MASSGIFQATFDLRVVRLPASKFQMVRHEWILGVSRIDYRMDIFFHGIYPMVI